MYFNIIYFWILKIFFCFWGLNMYRYIYVYVFCFGFSFISILLKHFLFFPSSSSFLPFTVAQCVLKLFIIQTRNKLNTWFYLPFNIKTFETLKGFFHFLSFVYCVRGEWRPSCCLVTARARWKRLKAGGWKQSMKQAATWHNAEICVNIYHIALDGSKIK